MAEQGAEAAASTAASSGPETGSALQPHESPQLLAAEIVMQPTDETAAAVDTNPLVEISVSADSLPDVQNKLDAEAEEKHSSGATAQEEERGSEQLVEVISPDSLQEVHRWDSAEETDNRDNEKPTSTMPKRVSSGTTVSVYSGGVDWEELARTEAQEQCQDGSDEVSTRPWC
jgi:hypothetical protein